MRLWLSWLQAENPQIQKIRIEAGNKQGIKDGWKKDADEMLLWKSLLYVPKIICIKLISCYHNDSLVGYFGIHKTWELVIQKYYWPSFYTDIEVYVKGCDIYLASKTIRHKLYKDL